MRRLQDREYEKLLDLALEKIPKVKSSKDRFEVPEPDVVVMGNRTVLRNLGEIAGAVNRRADKLMKYLLRELGTAGNLEGSRGVFQGKFGKSTIQDRVNRYVEEFVLCPVCGKPDTQIVKQGRIHMLKCEACGARSPIGGA